MRNQQDGGSAHATPTWLPNAHGRGSKVPSLYTLEHGGLAMSIGRITSQCRAGETLIAWANSPGFTQIIAFHAGVRSHIRVALLCGNRVRDRDRHNVPTRAAQPQGTFQLTQKMRRAVRRWCSTGHRFLRLKNEYEGHGAVRGTTDIVGTARLWALRISLPHGAASRWKRVML